MDARDRTACSSVWLAAMACVGTVAVAAAQDGGLRSVATAPDARPTDPAGVRAPLRLVRDGRVGFVGHEGRLLSEPAFVVLGEWREERLWVQKTEGDQASGFFVDAMARSLGSDPYRNLSEPRPELPLPFFERGIAVVGLPEGGCGYLDHSGRLIGRAAPAAALLRQEDDLLLGEQSGRLGYLDRTGVWRIPARFAEATPFRGGRAAARDAGGWRLLDPDGTWVGDASFDALRWFATNPRVWAYRKDGRWGLVDRDGRALCPPRFDELTEGRDDVVVARVDQLWGLVSETGETLVPPRYRTVAPFGDAPLVWQAQDDHGLWRVLDAAGAEVGEVGYDILEAQPGGVWLAQRDGFWGALAREGDWAIAPAFQRIVPIPESLGRNVLCEKNGLWGAFALADGTDVVPCRFLRIRTWHGLLAAEDGESAHLFGPRGESLLSWSGSVDGLPDESAMEAGAGVLRTRHGAALISAEGVRLWSAWAEDAGEWSEGLAPVRSGGLWGFADRGGQSVLAARFEAAKAFCDGVAPVRERGRWGLIDRAGEFLVPPQFADLGRSWNGLVPASRDGLRWGLIDREGREVLSLAYDAIEWGDASRDAAVFHGNAVRPTSGADEPLGDGEAGKAPARRFGIERSTGVSPVFHGRDAHAARGFAGASGGRKP